MKRGTLLLTLIAGLAVFLVVLVLYLPASWLAVGLAAADSLQRARRLDVAR